MNKWIVPLVLTAAVSLWGSHAYAASATVEVSDLSHIHGVAFLAEPRRGIALATHNGVYLVSEDGSAELASAPDDFMGFTAAPGGRLFASGHPATGGNIGVISSADGGSTWSHISDGIGGPVDFHAMSVSPVNPDLIYGLYGDIQMSLDGGKSWVVGGPAPEQTIDIAAGQAEGQLFAGTADGLLESSNHGASWSRVGPAGVPVTAVQVESEGLLYAYYVGAGLLRRSGDGKWEEISVPVKEDAILHLATDETDGDNLVAVTQTSQVLASRDGGETWSLFGQ